MNAETWFAALAALAVVNLALAIAALVRKRDDGTERIAGALREEIRASREDAAAQARQLREELGISQAHAGEMLLANIGRLGTAQKEQLDGLARAVHDSQQHTRTDLGGIRTEIQTRLQQIQTANENRFEHVRSTLTGELGRLQESQGKQIAEMIAALSRLTESSRQDQLAARELLEQRFAQIQTSNEKKLEEMRQTVDEKLQGTLEKRLGESFRQVSERLEAVQRGLGEMKNLADGVGDLKRVLTNVKERGTWGEYQLAAILEQVLTPDQYAANVRPKEGGEVVEYAIRLPGRNADGDGAPVWLPIDAKFPKEDYERLLAASEAADADAVRAAMSALANAVKKSAKDIHDKYIAPPATTDFAILFLPTEGLYAEVLRMPGLHDELQQKFRVLVAGPTTLAAILNSLRVGFQTLAIEQRSHEVWNTLRAVKTEFGKFGDVLEKVKKQLATASNTIDVAQSRTRAMARKLKSVEQLEESEATALLGVLPEDAVDDNADEPEETP